MEKLFQHYVNVNNTVRVRVDLACQLQVLETDY